MMNARIKLSAKAALTGSQSKIIPTLAAITVLIPVFSLCNFVMNHIPFYPDKSFFIIFSASTLLASLVAIAPLRLKMQINHLLLAKGKTNAYQSSAIGFRGILRACEMSICLFFIKLFFACAFEIIPITATVIFIMKGTVSLRAAAVFFSGMFILAIAGAGFYSVYIQRYSKAWFYLACYKDFTAVDAISESIRKTNGRCAEILFFKLGFLPWFLLCILVFPAFYVVPYYKQSITCLFLSR